MLKPQLPGGGLSGVGQENACFEPCRSWCRRWCSCKHAFTQSRSCSWYSVITLSLCSCQGQECRMHAGPHSSCHLFRSNSPVLTSRKTCCWCGKIYSVTSTGRHSRTEGCHYHFDRALSHKGEYLVVLFHLFDKPSQCQISREKGGIFSSMCIC